MTIACYYPFLNMAGFWGVWGVHFPEIILHLLWDFLHLPWKVMHLLLRKG
jgi:hypothetical protein